MIGFFVAVPLPALILAYILSRPGVMGSVGMAIAYIALATAIGYGIYLTLPPAWLR